MTLGPSPVTRVSGCSATAAGNKMLQAAAEWTRGDLNPRPRRCKRRALPAELRAPHTIYFYCCLTSTCECILYVDTVAIVRFIEMTACEIPLSFYAVLDH